MSIINTFKKNKLEWLRIVSNIMDSYVFLIN
ncbi:hypothetical protein BSF42_31560 [Flavobacterium sp. ACN6]|nr:hypothetical protein BSF42_31560 [Flavobacterium sp. ACN6]